MSPAQALQEALVEQEAVITTQRVPERQVDALGRPRTACCGALDTGDSDHGGRPFHCCHQYELWRDGRDG